MVEKAYHAEWDAFHPVPACPPGDARTDPVAWSRDWACARAFDLLGWLPDGPIRCRFSVVVDNRASAADDELVVRAECDDDGDSVYAVHEGTRNSWAVLKSPSDVW